MLGRLKAFLKKNLILYNFVVSLYYCLLKLYYFFYKCFNRVDDKAILFISFMGEQYSDNPRALYEYMIEHERHRGFHYYWVFKEPDKFKSHPALEHSVLIRYKSKEYYRICAKAKYWISNARMRNEIVKKKSQVYLQTWHGTPFKKLGYDISVENFNDIGGSLKELIKNYKKDAVRYDYMLSASPFYSEKIGSAFGLDRLNRMHIFMEYGYPRNDILFSYKSEMAEQLKDSLEIPKNKKVILYAPTFREAELGVNGYEYHLALDLEQFKEKLSDKYVVLFRLHYYISSHLDLSKYKGFLYDVSAYEDISHLYLISDMLITDYSSVFFDYANLCRPIIFYMYDLEKYNKSMHDFYLSFDELPGGIAHNQEELLSLIADEEIVSYDFEAFNQRFNPHRKLCAGKIMKRLLEL